jgi:hypothetical protein
VDILDPDVLILRRDAGSMVEASSSRGSTSESLRRAAEEDMQSRQAAQAHLSPSASSVAGRSTVRNAVVADGDV